MKYKNVRIRRQFTAIEKIDEIAHRLAVLVEDNIHQFPAFLTYILLSCARPAGEGVGEMGTQGAATAACAFFGRAARRLTVPEEARRLMGQAGWAFSIASPCLLP
jgi:hypothetical protein